MRRTLILSLTVGAILAAILAPSADALTVKLTRTIKVGTGAARMTTFTNSTASLYVNLKNLAPGTWGEHLWSGTCAALGTRVAVLPGLVVGASRAVARTNALTVSQARGRTLRLVRGTSVVCATFGTTPPVTPTTLVVTVLRSRPMLRSPT